MKKLFLIFSFFVMIYPLSARSLVNANNNFNGSGIQDQTSITNAEVQRISKRLNEIKTMDKSKLRPDQKQALKKELNGMKSSLSKSGPIFWFTFGALVSAIVIIILFI